jgi:hypothetical protein
MIESIPVVAFPPLRRPIVNSSDGRVSQQKMKEKKEMGVGGLVVVDIIIWQSTHVSPYGHL